MFLLQSGKEIDMGLLKKLFGKPSLPSSRPESEPGPQDPDGLVAAHQSAESWVAMAMLRLQADRYEECIECLDRATTLDPDHQEAWFTKASVYSQLGRYEEELACCDRFLEINANFAEAWSKKAAALVGLGRYQEAAAASDRATALNPVLGSAWMNKGAAMLGLNDIRTARACFQSALTAGAPRASDAIAHCNERIQRGEG
jgi:tetratricopeptide (TPR) repeat protein